MNERYFKRRFFYLKNVGCSIKVEQISRKEMLGWLDDYIACVKENNYYGRDINDTQEDTYEILYKDGTADYIDTDYDGHKVKRTNIVSIVNCNAESNMVYGPYAINEYGVVTTSTTEKIDNTVEEVNELVNV